MSDDRQTVSMTLCPWCYRPAPCPGRCTLVVEDRKAVVLIADGLAVVNPAGLRVVRRG